MRIRNLTDIDLYQTFWNIVSHSKINTKGVSVKITWIREHSNKGYAGHYDPKDHSISVRMNKTLTYPYPLQVATGEWFENKDGTYFQIYKTVRVDTTLQLCAFVFAHELSHYNDHMLGYSLRYKQTKADKTAFKLCLELGILKDELIKMVPA